LEQVANAKNADAS